MNGQVSFNTAINSLYYRITSVEWRVEDNQLTISVDLFINQTDILPLTSRRYYVDLDGTPILPTLSDTINGLVKSSVEADGLFAVTAFPYEAGTP